MDRVDIELVRLRMLRRRGTMLKFIRQGHEAQMHRMDDYEMWKMMGDLNLRMSRRNVVTMLQDLAVLGWVAFKQDWSDDEERYELSEIILTASGLTLVTRGHDTDEVIFS